MKTQKYQVSQQVLNRSLAKKKSLEMSQTRKISESLFTF